MTLKGAFCAQRFQGRVGLLCCNDCLSNVACKGKPPTTPLYDTSGSTDIWWRAPSTRPGVACNRPARCFLLRDPDRNRTCDVRGMLPECCPQGFSTTITGSPYSVISYKVHSKPSITPPHVAGQHSSTNAPKAVECCPSGPDGNRTRLASLAHQC